MDIDEYIDGVFVLYILTEYCLWSPSLVKNCLWGLSALKRNKR